MVRTMVHSSSISIIHHHAQRTCFPWISILKTAEANAAPEFLSEAEEQGKGKFAFDAEMSGINHVGSQESLRGNLKTKSRS